MISQRGAIFPLSPFCLSSVFKDVKMLEIRAPRQHKGWTLFMVRDYGTGSNITIKCITNHQWWLVIHHHWCSKVVELSEWGGNEDNSIHRPDRKITAIRSTKWHSSKLGKIKTNSSGQDNSSGSRSCSVQGPPVEFTLGRIRNPLPHPSWETLDKPRHESLTLDNRRNTAWRSDLRLPSQFLLIGSSKPYFDYQSSSTGFYGKESPLQSVWLKGIQVLNLQ